MRLIDLDSEYIQETLYRRSFKTRQDIEEWLNNAPIIDAVPVVRCEKCVAHGSCFAERVFVYTGIENPYCCAGERKEGADNG